jgi:hypothetical protein
MFFKDMLSNNIGVNAIKKVGNGAMDLAGNIG